VRPSIPRVSRRATAQWSIGDLRTALPGLAALGIAIALAIEQMTLRLVGYDLAAYILGSRRLISGEHLYQRDVVGLGPFGQFVYPPPVALAFIPFAVLPFDLARGVVLALLVSVAAVLTWSLVRTLPPRTRYWGAAAIVAFFPLIYEVTLENVTLVTLALCVLAWHLRRRAARAGALFALALGLKLLPVSLLAYLAVARRGRVIVWSGLVLLGIAVASWPFVGAEWSDFLSLLARLARASSASPSNIAPAVFSVAPFSVLLPGLSLGVAMMCGAVSLARDDREDHAFRVALAAVPLVAATLWYPYLVFALPLLVTSAPPAPARALRIPFAAARPASWILIEIQRALDPKGDLVVPLIGLLLLLAVGLLELWPTHEAAAMPISACAAI
jgi:glycosyl transferase family 87